MEGQELQEYKTSWQRKQRREFSLLNGYSTTANYAVDGKREDVLLRDGYKCVKCGMTDKEHKAKWGRPITIDHKDKNRKNNAMGNLQTLCLRCHGRKDLLPRLRESKAALLKEEMVDLRNSGMTYQQIADKCSMSIATAFKWIKKWEEENQDDRNRDCRTNSTRIKYGSN